MSSSLEKAQHATDAANERAAKAAILIKKLGSDTTIADDKVFVYDAVNGQVVDTDAAIPAAGYGKHDAHGAGHNGKVLALKIDSTDTVTMVWLTRPTSIPAASAVADDGKLCSAKSAYTH